MVAMIRFFRTVLKLPFPWLPLIIWLWFRFGQIPSDGFFRNWVISVMVLNTISLLIDLTDVARYILGDHRPQVILWNL